MATEGLTPTKHYLGAYQTIASFNLTDWVRMMSSTEDFSNPFSPSEPDYFSLDPDWLPLADLDAVMRNPRHPQSATCFAWWLVHKDWTPFFYLRPPTFWRRAMKKAFIFADLKSLRMNEEQLLSVLKAQFWWTPQDEAYLIRHRQKIWPQTHWFDPLLFKFKEIKGWLERKHNDYVLNQVLKRGMNGKFIPRNRTR